MSKLSKLILRDFKPQSKHSPKATQTRNKWNILKWKTCISRALVVVDASRALFWCSCVWLLLRLPVSPGSPFRFRMPRAGPVLPKSDPGSRPRSEKHKFTNHQNKTDLSPYSPKKRSASNHISGESSVWLYDAFSPGNIGLPPALRGGTSLRQNIVTFFEKKAESQWTRESVPGELPARPDYSSCRGIHHLQKVGSSQGWMFNRGQVVLIIWFVQERIVEATPTC